MKTIFPGRKRLISCGCGSLTLMIRSASANGLRGCRDDGRADGFVIVVGEPAGQARLGFEEHLMAGLDHCLGPDGHEGDTIFVRLNFLWDSNRT